MSSASWALQEALFACLGADDSVTGLIGDPPRLYDAPQRHAVFPYMVLAEDSETLWDGDGGVEHQVLFHIWSQAGGRKECKTIADAVCTALDNAALTLDGHHLVSLRCKKAEHGREKDGVTFRSRLQFRAVTEPSS